MKRLHNYFTLSAITAAVFALSACNSGIKTEGDYPKTKDEVMEERVGKLTGEGIVLYGGKSSSKATEGINVNSYLWRATLDTVYFMPLLNADPFGGTVVTDWYQMNQNSNERYKLNIVIIGAELRPDALKVAAFKQVMGKNGAWTDQGNNNLLAKEIEDKILIRARELRFKSAR